MFKTTKISMVRLMVLVVGMMVMVGCAGENPEDGSQGEAQLTIFGRLSEVFQLGSTEEAVLHRVRTNSYVVSADAEVLMNRPAFIAVTVTDKETGAVRDDVQVSMSLCQAVDMEVGGIDGCSGGYDGEVYRHDVTANAANGVYLLDQFDWQRPGHWNGEMTITAADGSTEVIEFGAGVYPQRPPSTNAFELTSISLPFIVIGIFLAVLFAMRGALMQSARGEQMATAQIFSK